MAEPVDARIISSHDETKHERLTGKVTRVQVVDYTLGELGPFRAELSDGVDGAAELRRQQTEKAATLGLYLRS